MVRWMPILTVLGLCLLSLQGQAGERQSRCYRVDERGPQYLDQSPYVLCLISSDLQKYPKSVVTITVSKDNKIVAKRHYTATGRNAFGRRVPATHEHKSLVVFDHGHNVVQVGFLSKDAKRFYFKPIEQSKDPVPGQKLELGKLDER